MTFSVISFIAREKEFFCKGSFAIQTVKNSRASLSTIFLFAEKSILETEALSSYPLYSQDAKKKDAMCIAVFYLGNIRWYIMEGQQEGNDFTLYGIVAGLQETEYGYQSATEMASITYDASEYGLGTLRIEQDKDFKPCKLADIKDEELQLFLSRLYDKD